MRFVRSKCAYLLAFAFWICGAGPALSSAQNTWEDNISQATKALDEGRLADAEPLLGAALAQAEKFGAEDARLGGTLSALADVYRREGKYADAEPLFKRSRAIMERALGPDHPDVALILHYLAVLYLDQGKYQEAEPLLKRALAIREKALGPDHTDVGSDLYLLATLFQDQGKYQDAEPLFKRALAIVEKAAGPDHPDVASTLNNLAELYLEQSKYAEAEPLLKRALAISEKALGPDHPDVASVLEHLAMLYLRQGKYAEAERLFKRALATVEKGLGPDHPNVASAMNNLALLYMKQGRYADAEPLYKRALAIREKALGPDHPELASIVNDLASLCMDQGKYADAEPLYKRALAIREKALGPEHPDVALTSNNLAALYLNQGKYADAEPLYKRALAIWEKALGPEHPDVANSLDNLGLLYVYEGKYSEAQPLFKRALAISEKSLGPDHPDVALAVNDLAWFYLSQGKYSEAEPLFKRALAVEENVFGPTHAYTIQTLDSLAILYSARGSPEQADAFFDRALENQARQFEYLFPYMTEKERLSFSYLDTVSQNYPPYYTFCFKYGQQNPALLEKMYDVILWQKGFVGRSIAAGRSKIAASNDKEALGLLATLTAKRSQLAALVFAKDTDAGRLKQTIEQLSKESNDIESELLKRSRTLADDKKLAQVTWQDVQRSLKPGEAAVELVKFQFVDGIRWTKVYYVALIVTPETKAPVLVQLSEGSELEKTPLLKYRELASEHAASSQADDGVYRSLWKPIEAALGDATTIYLSPDGVLNLVAFPVIPIGNGRRLIDKYDIRVVASTKDLIRDDSAAPTNSAVLIGDPRFDLTEAEQRAAVHAIVPAKSENGTFIAGPGTGLRADDLRTGNKLSALPATKVEIASIRSLLEKQGWKVQAYTGEQATVEAIKHVLGPRVLHVATHAFFLKDQVRSSNKMTLQLPPGYEDPMLRSGLFFAGAGRVLRGEKPAEDLEDGILTAYEATGLNLQGTELVVLSACETGRGQIANGEGVFGLRRALQEAGARAVLMSLWSVPDRETQELMTLFYGKWLAGEDKQQALREAELELRTKVKARYGEDRPFYWGGFVLVGR